MRRIVRKPLIAGNWKMNLSLQEALDLTKSLVSTFRGYQKVAIAICPPFPYLLECSKILSDTPILLGAQNMHEKSDGAFTGEVSGASSSCA